MKKTDKIEAVEVAVEPVQEAQKVETVPIEPEYTFAELVESHKAMGHSAECVVAALRHRGIKKATFAAAKVAVDQFMRRVIE